MNSSHIEGCATPTSTQELTNTLPSAISTASTEAEVVSQALGIEQVCLTRDIHPDIGELPDTHDIQVFHLG